MTALQELQEANAEACAGNPEATKYTYDFFCSTTPADSIEPMKELFDNVKEYKNVSMDELSMGMSGDYETAIKCGATMIRVGSAIFGARNYKTERCSDLNK